MAKLALLILALAATGASAAQAQNRANPIRKVVTMLQQLQAKVEEEGKVAEDLYEKFMCYCKTAGGDLSTGIEAAKTKIPELESSIEEAVSQKAQLEKDLEEHKADREAAKTAMAEATGVREKEKAAFDKEAAEDQANLSAMGKALAAIEKGMGSSFLQSATAVSKVRALVQASKVVEEVDREDVLSFLSGQEGDEYAPASGEIVGILKQMNDEMTKDYETAVAEEAAAVKSYGELMAAKKSEIAALSKMLEEKLERVGTIGVEIAEMKNDLEDTSEGLAEDQKFLADMEKNCKTKTGEFEEEKKVRAEEVQCLAETVKLLNDDDALDLFKKTLPSSASSFMQVQVSESAMRSRAMNMLVQMKKRFPGGKHRLNFIALALHGKKIGFDKIIKMIDELVATLKTEQKNDEDKVAYCEKEFDVSDDEKKGLERSIKDLETVISEAKESIQTLADEIVALEKGIKNTDKAVQEATEQRKEENAEYKELMAGNGAAKELILFAKNRMNKFYNPKLYKAPPKAEGEEAAAFVQIRMHRQEQQVAPPPPPETAAAYSKKSEESGGVMAMMDLLVKELDKEMTVAEAEEKNAQEDYETTMKDSAEKRALDAKAITDKEAAKAETQAALEKAKTDKKSAGKELGATLQYIHSLHLECDWLMKYFDVRKEARTSEIDALGKAKAVLSGADYSFVQTGASRRFLRHA